ncbi:glycosyltransferase family 9 protein [Chitinivorax sp. B]|uniref:glycosyltransferase family 9 protein n=1 Tax=Chitinivorax sp. B TaxID=2502235 RepID=UPI0014856758|nr:glycosyltransferase family 9 protein [Chitinivorax sp. B]
MTHAALPEQIKILIIRRDNIGDLVCTTPMIASLRQHYPNARIDALVNSYNVAVLSHNPHLDHVYAYTKGKHLTTGQSAWANMWRRFRLYIELLICRYDYIILAGNGYIGRAAGMARRLLPRHIIGFTPDGKPVNGIDLPQTVPTVPMHCVQVMAPLVAPLKIEGSPPGLVLAPDPVEVEKVVRLLKSTSWYRPETKMVGLHISARKPSQRWPTEHFVALARRLHQQTGCGFMLFWSPGDEHNPHHPGDDRKAASIIAALQSLPILPCPTQHLQELIASLSVVDTMVCSDGGAMHVAAGLGKPMVCFFGQSDAHVWHPWGVPFELVQPASKQVADISVDEALAAYDRLSHHSIPG